jgi:type I restriction enzyme S subunit
MRWQVVKIDSLKADARYSLVGGPFGSDLTTRDYVEDGVPVVRGTNLPDDREFLDDGFVYVREEKADALKSNTAYPGDLVFTQRGTLGQVGIIPERPRYSRYLISQSQMKLTVDPKRVCSRYIYYYFRHPETIQKVRNQALTSGVPHINLGILKTFEIPLPPLPVQMGIIKVLSTYDGLIENNRRRMELLEDAARQMYQEWFVRLRFPGYEHTRIVNGSPDNWERCRVIDFGTVITGKTPSTRNKDYYGSDIPFVKTPDMHGNVHVLETATNLSEKGANTQAGKFLPAGTLLVSCIGTVGVVSITSETCQFNQQINAVVPFSDYYRYYCFFAFKNLKPRLDAIGGGVTMANVSKGKFENLDIICPARDLLQGFDEFCNPIFNQIQSLARQNQKLRTARDLLLPKLMSGEMSV